MTALKRPKHSVLSNAALSGAAKIVVQVPGVTQRIDLGTKLPQVLMLLYICGELIVRGPSLFVQWYQGAEPDLMFELQHQNTQPLIFKPRTASSSSGSERNSAADDSSALSPTALSPHVKSSADTTTPRLIFRTDSAAATTK